MFKIIGRSSNWIRRTSTNTSPSAGPSTQRSLSSVPLPLNNTTLSHNHCLQQGVINCAPSQLKHTFYRNMSSEEASSQPLKQLNRLAQEKSPYLLQHATNPVDWYPWGDEAIERARRENKIIFVSVGYSTCHWCHVMEAESFNNANVAKLMNENFINVKIDREERPDIDKIYMQFVLMMNGTAGWPMSVWLTPDLAPITAGTYFPPVDRYGMASFTTVLKVIATKWQSDQAELRETGHNVVTAIQQSLSEKNCTCVYEPGSADAKLRAAMTIFKQRFDQQFGGFGTHPKFPEVPRLNFLFHAYVATKDSDVLDMALQTLRKVGNGGIHDHVFGGFSRYSVDRQWHVPHFEKMLYDQGQLMAAYATAYKMTREEDFLRIGDRIFRYIMKDLRHPDGGFYSGEDADSLPVGETRKIEGAFYTWTASEIQGEIAEKVALYPDEFDAERVFKIYSYHYDVRPVGNVEPSNDPYGHFGGKNILIVRHSEEDTRTKYGLTEEQLKQILRITNDALLKRREQRPRPPLDTKIITSWNGLLLSGLSKLANCGSEKREEYMEAARKLLDFIRGNLYDAERRRLWRSCYGVGTDNSALESNSVRIDGFLDDYAFLIKGLHDYYKASLDADALHWSKELQDVQDQLFWDEQRGAYYFSQTDAPNVVMRLKPDHDSAEPSGNSVAARNLILLSYYFDDEGYRKRVAKLFNFFVDSKVFNPSLPEMACALLLNENGLDLVAVVGPDSEVTQRFVDICRKFYIPGMIILHVDPQNPTEMYKRLEEKFKMVQDKPTVYICHEKVCRMPVTDPAKLEQHLEEHYVFKNNI